MLKQISTWKKIVTLEYHVYRLGPSQHSETKAHKDWPNVCESDTHYTSKRPHTKWCNLVKNHYCDSINISVSKKLKCLKKKIQSI